MFQLIGLVVLICVVSQETMAVSVDRAGRIYGGPLFKFDSNKDFLIY